ncbi:hypothetical protein [Streptomyces sp. NBC_00091]|uniref:hypothetical protein n=1 Tax=Streptomyces sp. NBC_00091 TaxID=2975648 RepID=UPI002257D233|nr:hypothetical protein [Streptomyces sp. NBC_00091]MCX5379352.1 hypothetical protein [Streptomyces sp. NBC_00091]
MRGTGQDAQRGRAVAAALLRGQGGLAGSLAGSGPEAWIAFDQEVRRLGSHPDTALRSTRIEARLCDPDGRIRASALAAWRNPPLPLVLIRCADWVPQVRDRARRVLGRAVANNPPGARYRTRRLLGQEVADDSAHALTELTPLVIRLGGREHGTWALEQMEAALSGRYTLLAAWWRPGQAATTWSWNSLTPKQRGAMLERLRKSTDLPTRRFATRLTLATGQFGVREFARGAAVEHDPWSSRMWTDAALAAMAADGPDDEAIDILLGGRRPMVRAAGVTALRGAGRSAQAAEHLADRSAMVRACARWLVRQDGGDPYAHYLGLVTDPERVSRYAVAGFCECARRDDTPLLHALLDHPADAVRAAALAGLRHLDATTPDAVLLAMLDDPSASVTREAGLCLRPVARRLDPGALAARTAPERPAHTRRAAFRLLRAQGGIAALQASVALSVDPDPDLRRLVDPKVRRFVADTLLDDWSP